MTNALSSFASDFLESYLKFGLGSMSKSDIDALVMALLDRYGDGSGAMASLSNQTVSERLRMPPQQNLWADSGSGKAPSA
jgi:hypothetical protein